MTDVAAHSSNTLVANGGQIAPDGVPADGTGVLQIDPWLSPFQDALKRRYSKAKEWIQTIDDTEGGLAKFTKVRGPSLSGLRLRSLTRIAKGADIFGLNVDEHNNIIYREWAPNAQQAFLIGDFSRFCKANEPCSIFSLTVCADDWNRDSHPMKKNEYGVFKLTLPPVGNGQPAIPHNSKIKVRSLLLSDPQGRELTLLARSRWSSPAERELTVFPHGSNT